MIDVFRSLIPALFFVQTCPIRVRAFVARTDPKGTLVDLADRDRRLTRAEALVPDLAARGVVAGAASFVDNAGLARGGVL
jgi:hypothetical protein